MTTLEITLTVLLYIAISTLSYKPFNKIKGVTVVDNPIISTILWPVTWAILFVLAVIVGFKTIFKD
jgi:cell shape-determining protein MreD